MKALVAYQSKTGFTEKYAEWISGELSCDIKEISQVNSSDIDEADLVIYGGWIMGGMISGLDKLKKLTPKKIIVFGVGFTAKAENDNQKIVSANNLDDVPFFYYEGGVNPKKMGFMGRTIVKMVTKKPLEYTDNTNKSDIEELVKQVKKM